MSTKKKAATKQATINHSLPKAALAERENIKTELTGTWAKEPASFPPLDDNQSAKHAENMHTISGIWLAANHNFNIYNVIMITDGRYIWFENAVSRKRSMQLDREFLERIQLPELTAFITGLIRTYQAW